MIVMAVLNTINMGCVLDMSVVKQNIFRPVGPIVGFVSQFTFMPLVRGIIYTVKVTTVYKTKCIAFVSRFPLDLLCFSLMTVSKVLDFWLWVSVPAVWLQISGHCCWAAMSISVSP